MRPKNPYRGTVVFSPDTPPRKEVRLPLLPEGAFVPGSWDPQTDVFPGIGRELLTPSLPETDPNHQVETVLVGFLAELLELTTRSTQTYSVGGGEEIKDSPYKAALYSAAEMVRACMAGDPWKAAAAALVTAANAAENNMSLCMAPVFEALDRHRSGGRPRGSKGRVVEAVEAAADRGVRSVGGLVACLGKGVQVRAGVFRIRNPGDPNNYRWTVEADGRTIESGTCTRSTLKTYLSRTRTKKS